MLFGYKRLRNVLVPAAIIFFSASALNGAIGGQLASDNPKALALYKEGIELAGQDRFNEAITKLKAAIQADSNFIQAHLRYMDAFQGVGRSDEVADMYRKKVEANPNNPVYRYLLGRATSDMPGKRGEFLKALQSDSTFYWAPYGIGGTYYIEGRLDEAVTYLNRALRLNPQMVDALKLLGEVYLEKEMFLQAKDHLEQAIRLDSSDIGNYVILGQTFSRMDRYESAEKAFRTAAGLDPDHPQPWYFLGLLYEMNDENQKALGAYRKFLEVAPEDEMAPVVERNIENLKKAGVR